jgi:hypothetical protein
MPARGPDADIWGEDDNARRYDAFARQHPIYQDTSRDLIALAGLSGRFVFNTGAGYLGQQEDPNFGDDRPSPVSIMRDIAARDYGWRPPGPAAPPSGESAPHFGGEPKHGTGTVLRVADEFPRRRIPGPWFMIVNS